MKALYAGSFDPFTLGHLDIVRRARTIFPDLTVGVAVNAGKSYMFTATERKTLIERVLSHAGLGDVRTEVVAGLVADYANINGHTHLVKGARATDFNYERIVHDVTLTQQHSLETVLLFASRELEHVSSSVAKDLARNQGLQAVAGKVAQT